MNAIVAIACHGGRYGMVAGGYLLAFDRGVQGGRLTGAENTHRMISCMLFKMSKMV